VQRVAEGLSERQEIIMDFETIEVVYNQRNQAAIAFAKLALGVAGFTVGTGLDAASPMSKVLYVELPTGEQLSWHLTEEQYAQVYYFPAFEAGFDGTHLARNPYWADLV
jgi:hypothetical protein